MGQKKSIALINLRLIAERSGADPVETIRRTPSPKKQKRASRYSGGGKKQRRAFRYFGRGNNVPVDCGTPQSNTTDLSKERIGRSHTPEISTRLQIGVRYSGTIHRWEERGNWGSLSVIDNRVHISKRHFRNEGDCKDSMVGVEVSFMLGCNMRGYIAYAIKLSHAQ